MNFLLGTLLSLRRFLYDGIVPHSKDTEFHKFVLNGIIEPK